MPEKDLFGPIISEICNALSLLGGQADLLATVGSWRDTMDDKDTLTNLRAWVEYNRAYWRQIEADIAERRINAAKKAVE